MSKAILCACAALVFLATAALAAERTLTVSHTCLVGDNDTKAEVRRTCFLEAKRKAVEQAGTYVESITEVREFALSADQVRSFAAAVVRVEDIAEKFALQGENLALTVTVRARVDPDAAAERLAAAARDPKALEALSRSARTARDLEDQALALQGRIRGADPDQALALRREQHAAFTSLDEALAERERILSGLAAASRLAREVVRPGMTAEEVAGLLGPPRAAKENNAPPAAYACLNYGRVWVVFKDGLVACLRERLVYKERFGGDCHCGGVSLDGLVVE